MLVCDGAPAKDHSGEQGMGYSYAKVNIFLIVQGLKTKNHKVNSQEVWTVYSVDSD